MALVLNDRVQQTGTANTTVSFTLSGSVTGFQSFAVVGNGNTTYYSATDASGNWEVGIGTYATSGPTLTRTTILASSNSGSAVTFSGAVNVFVTYPAEKSINYDANDVATIGQTLGYADTGIIGSFASTVAGYNQVVVQNKSTATNASSNFNVSNDAGTAGSNYAELGINSSTFVGTGSFNIAGASYVASASTDLTLGTYGAYSIHFVTNSNTTDAMTIYNNGGVSLGTFGNPGINNLAASKFVPGYTAVTSAAGTTVLTADSNYYQNLVGTTTQTFRLPDATTLLVGTTFIFDNNSTGVLTIVDNASGSVDTLASGAAGFVYLANNSTVAGSWNRHSFLPVTYDFNLTTANFGNATITNALWNGTTIGTAYGGTGLTTFGAANYALYSTSSSALVAGTLPIAAGGTAATTFTANGVLYGNGTSALGVTAAGTTGQVLIGNTGAAPSWGTVSSSLVSSFSAGTTGFTPNTATTGAVTLAGTLNVANGGTGTATAFTPGSVVFAGTSGTYTQDNANFFWDDTNNRLGIGTATPNQSLSIFNATNATLVVTSEFLTNIVSARYSTDSGSPFITCRKGRGTAASQTAVASGDQLGSLLFQAFGGTNNRNISSISGLVDTYTSDTNISSLLTFGTSPSGSAAATERMRITSAGGISFGSSGTAYGTSGQTLISAGNAPPTWGTLGPTSGGTGLTAYTTGDIIYASATNTLSALADVATGNALISGGVGVAPSWGKIGLTTHISGTLPVANGGTGQTTYTNGQLLIGNTTGNTLAKATLTQGTGVTITNGAGSINVAIGQAVSTSSNVQFGSFGVGTVASGTTGEIRATNNVTAFYSSDKKLKENIKDVENALEKVCVIGSKTFDWTDDYIKEHGGEDSYFIQKSDFGVIAQDVQTVFPQAVRTRDDGTLAVDYEKLSTLAFGAIKELVKRIEILEAK